MARDQNSVEMLLSIYLQSLLIDARLCHGINSKGKLFVALFVSVKTVKRLP
jgi:hypothetical protein